jgi:hypothetical protein
MVIRLDSPHLVAQVAAATDGVWEAVVEAALDPAIAPPAVDLVPADDPEVASDEPGVEAGGHVQGDHLVGHDEADHHDDAGGAPDELHAGSEKGEHPSIATVYRILGDTSPTALTTR